jgi:hypothetical protein
MMTGAMRAEEGTSTGTNSLGLNVDPLVGADAHLFLSIFSYSHVREAIVSPPFDVFTSIKLVMEPESFLKNTKNNKMLVLCACMNDYHGTPKFLQQHRPLVVASTVTSPK